MKQSHKGMPVLLLLMIPFIILTASCSSRIVRQFSRSSELSSASGPLENVKIHMKDGSLYVIDSLMANENPDTVAGYGSFYNPYRDIVKKNNYSSGYLVFPPFKIALSDIALVEMNQVRGYRGKALSLALIAVPTVLLTGYCLLDPKACFGSCPTFYAWDGKDTTLMAEGFSSSILRAYEKEDIDMLYNTQVDDSVFHLRMKNEALETQVIRYADLMAIPRAGKERVFATGDGEFYTSSQVLSPSSCIAPEGNCLEALKRMDNKERYSASDPDNLISRETIEINFENIPREKLGLIIGCRQTLLTTYLFYQSLAYLGRSAGYFAARIESGDHSLQRRVDRVWDLLGGIEIFVQDSKGQWKKVDQLDEMGPIATDVHLIPLPETKAQNLTIRLRLTKGLWRINYIALGQLDHTIEPFTIHPSKIIAGDVPGNDITPLFNDPENPLITLPGDVYDIYYTLPGISSDYEIFLHSKGYYIEWMRETWLQEESRKKAALFFGFPRLYMKMAADDFKKIEPSMEKSFWNSKYVKKD
jgi:hypothetical protein